MLKTTHTEERSAHTNSEIASMEKMRRKGLIEIIGKLNQTNLQKNKLGVDKHLFRFLKHMPHLQLPLSYRPRVLKVL